MRWLINLQIAKKVIYDELLGCIFPGAVSIIISTGSKQKSGFCFHIDLSHFVGVISSLAPVAKNNSVRNNGLENLGAEDSQIKSEITF